MAFTSKHRFARIAARKARLVTDLIRNKPVGEALDLLKFSKKRAAVMVNKVLKSAIANADAKEADVENLYVAGSFADDGPIMKRMMEKDRGKSYTIFKRTCHITVQVEEGPPPMARGKRRQLENKREALLKRKPKGGTKAKQGSEVSKTETKEAAAS